MRYAIAIAAILLSTAAVAQPAPEPTSTKAVRLLLNQERAAHENDATAAFSLNEQIDGLKKQIADLTKERDDAQAKVKTDPTPPPAR
jgi:peptidoglycan hydrolase CwlO-like protein